MSLLQSATNRSSMTRLQLLQGELQVMDRQAESLGQRNERALRDELERIEASERDAGVCEVQVLPDHHEFGHTCVRLPAPRMSKPWPPLFFQPDTVLDLGVPLLSGQNGHTATAATH